MRIKTQPPEDEEDIESETMTTEYETFRLRLAAIPQLGRLRTVKNMTPFVELLIETNPFFRNTPTVLVSSLLKVCSIRTFARQQQVYRKSEKLISFYIVLWGRVRVSDVLADFRKVCTRGETLCEHILFLQDQPSLRM